MMQRILAWACFHSCLWWNICSSLYLFKFNYLFSYYSPMRVLCIFDTSPLSGGGGVCRYFLPIFALSFHFLNGICRRADVSNFVEAQFIYVLIQWTVSAKNYFPKKGTQGFLQKFHSPGSLTHLELILLLSEIYRLSMFFCLWMSNWSSTFCWADHTGVGPFPVSLSCPTALCRSCQDHTVLITVALP